MYLGYFSLLLVLSSCLLLSLDAAPYDPQHKQRRVYDPSKVYVHIVPHTHDDVGWLKTVDEYYIGAGQEVQHAAVQYILDSVINELQKDENRTFIYVEMAFFTRWWDEQSKETQAIVKKLVANKQLEFINGGWCMNDEATTDYNSIIDQMTVGLNFILETFGPSARPRVAWQIDPFGHSSEMAAIFAMMGYDGLFFGRNDYADRHLRLNKTEMEMVWQPSRSLGDKVDLFTGILYYSIYGPPPGFCFDTKCTDPPIQDDPNLFDMNVDSSVERFIDAIYDQLSHYATNHIMFTMGSDFQYENANRWYKNLDKIMKYTMEKNSSIELFYSTPSHYLDALYDANITWPTKSDDFFPYADSPYAYWTGYFTSRPALKAYGREMNSLMQVCKQLEAFSSGFGAKTSNATSETLQKALALVQHHDAISGTEKQHVADDYAKRLHIGQVECEALIHDVTGTFMGSKTSSSGPVIESCEYLNISICPATAKNSFNVAVYNPLIRTIPIVMRLPVNSLDLVVTDDRGKLLKAQVAAMSEGTKFVQGPRGTALYEIVFKDSLPGLGGKTYFVRPPTLTNHTKIGSKKAPPISVLTKQILLDGKDIKLDSNLMSVIIDGTTGRLKTINNIRSGISVNVDQEFMRYNSSIGKDKNSTQRSGAYIFRPNSSEPMHISTDGSAERIFFVKGDLYNEVQQVFAYWLYQTIRVYNDLPFVELEYTVGPIPYIDFVGKEIISRFTTDLATDETWYTDANCREMQKRIRNRRDTWNLNNTEPVSQNYFPVNSRIYMRDRARNVQFTVLTDRSQGGSSLTDGQLELMVHRRILFDDNRGVDEPLNEKGQFGDGLIIRGRHLVLVDTIVNSTSYHRLLAESMLTHSHPMFIQDEQPPSEFINKYHTNFSVIANDSLPTNVHLLTLQYLSPGRLLLRLEHQFEADEAPWNQTVDIPLAKIFLFNIVDVTELTLGGNALAPVDRLKWTKDDGAGPEIKSSPKNRFKPVKGPLFTVTLRPMEIRTFEIKVQL